jgi:Raf kinase inhibitor-like YbhB/YbcL family protein
MKLTSPVFENGQYIPVEFTSEGSGISPALTWNDAPSGTRSFAIVMIDRDIPSPSMRWGKFSHWIVYNIPAEAVSLSSDFTIQESERVGAVIAPNGAGKRGYYPPCPFSGTHEYVFTLIALDVPKIAPPSEKPEQVLREIERHTLETSELVGLYKCTKFTGWQALQWNCGLGQKSR